MSDIDQADIDNGHPNKIGIDQADIDNGWTAESLEQYRQERRRAFDLTPGNVVTEFKRPKAPMQIIGAKGFKPHDW